MLFYLKLLVESVDHDGSLRFSDTIPYNDQMLSTITNTNIDTVHRAMDILEGLHLVEILDDQTIFMQEVEKMVGSEGWSTQRTRRYRAKLQDDSKKNAIASHVTFCDARVTSCDEEKELEKDKELELDTTELSNDNSCPNIRPDENPEPKKTTKRRTYEPDSVPYRLAVKLEEMIHANNPEAKAQSEPGLQSWANTFRLMIEQDKRTPRAIYDVMFYAQNDDFWKSNILSAAALRKQYDRLRLKMEGGK